MPRSSAPRTCGRCLFLTESRCGFCGRNPDGSLWHYADRPRLTGQAACIHFEPGDLPPCFHPGGRFSDEPIEPLLLPYLPSQAEEILARLRHASRDDDGQADAAFDRIRRAALHAQDACRKRFFEIEDAYRKPGYDLPAALRKVAERGRIPPDANHGLYDALAYGVAKANLADLPLAPRSFDNEAPHPLEQILRALPSRMIRRAAEAARDPDSMLFDKPGAPSDDTKDELIATVVQEYRDLSQEPDAAPRLLVDLVQVAIEPVSPLSVSSIRKLLKTQ
jgi:hypothetical protein